MPKARDLAFFASPKNYFDGFSKPIHNRSGFITAICGIKEHDVLPNLRQGFAPWTAFPEILSHLQRCAMCLRSPIPFLTGRGPAPFDLELAQDA